MQLPDSLFGVDLKIHHWQGKLHDPPWEPNRHAKKTFSGKEPPGVHPHHPDLDSGLQQSADVLSPCVGAKKG